MSRSCVRFTAAELLVHTAGRFYNRTVVQCFYVSNVNLTRINDHDLNFKGSKISLWLIRLFDTIEKMKKISTGCFYYRLVVVWIDWFNSDKYSQCCLLLYSEEITVQHFTMAIIDCIGCNNIKIIEVKCRFLIYSILYHIISYSNGEFGKFTFDQDHSLWK